jgi:hypothetical protein
MSLCCSLHKLHLHGCQLESHTSVVSFHDMPHLTQLVLTTCEAPVSSKCTGYITTPLNRLTCPIMHTLFLRTMHRRNCRLSCAYILFLLTSCMIMIAVGATWISRQLCEGQAAHSCVPWKTTISNYPELQALIPGPFLSPGVFIYSHGNLLTNVRV